MLTVLGKDLGGGEIHEMTIGPFETGSDASRPSAGLAQPVVSQDTIGAASSPRHSEHETPH